MPLATDCPECGKEFVLPDHLFGRRIKCKHCTAIFRVGGASAPPEHDDFNSDDASQETLIGGAAQEDVGGEELARPGVQSFANESTEAPTGPIDFGETVLPAASAFGQDTAADSPDETWDGIGDTEDGDQYFGSGDTAVDGLEPHADSGDTVSDGLIAGQVLPDETATDMSGQEVSDVTVTDDYADEVADELAEAEVEADSKSAAPKLPGKASLPGKGKLPGKGALPGKGMLPGKGTLPGKGAGKLPSKGTSKLPGKGALPAKGKGIGKAALPAKALGKKTGKLDVAATETAKKKSKLPLMLMLFLLFLIGDAAAILFVPSIREMVGLTDNEMVNNLAESVGGERTDKKADNGGDTVADDPPADDPPADDPPVDDPPMDDPPVDDPPADDPPVDDPPVDDPPMDDPPADDPPADDPPVDDPPVDDPPADDPPVDDPPVDDPPVDDPPVDDPPADDPPVDDPPVDDPPADDPPADDPPADDPPMDDPPADDPPEDDPPVDDPPMDDPPVDDPPMDDPPVDDPPVDDPPVDDPPEDDPPVDDPPVDDPPVDDPPMDDPEPLPDPEVEDPKDTKNPVKTDWPKFVRKKPKPFEAGKPNDYYSEDFDNARYDWKWLPAGVKVESGKPGKHGVLSVGADKQFHTKGDVADGEIRTRVKRAMSDADRKETKKTYEIHFRYKSANNYHALQIRGDGYYRVVRVAGGKSTTLVGGGNGGFLPIARWNRNKDSDEVVVTFRGTFVGVQVNNIRLFTSDEAGEGAGKVGVRTKGGMKVELQRLSVSE